MPPFCFSCTFQWKLGYKHDQKPVMGDICNFLYQFYVDFIGSLWWKPLYHREKIAVQVTQPWFLPPVGITFLRHYSI